VPPIPPADPDDPVGTIRASVEAREAAAPAASDEALLIYAALREEMDRRGVRYPILAPAYGHGVWTNTALMQTMVLDPDLARRHFALATRDCAAAARRYAAGGVELIGVGGDFAGNRGPLVSPACYRSLIAPELRELSDEVHALGCHAVNASDGDLWPVIGDFLLTAGVDGYIEIDERAGMDLGRLKARFGARITFFGNLDCGTLLSFGTPEDVKRAVTRCLRDGWGGGGHILCASNAVTETVPLANYRAIGEAYRAFFGME